MLNVANCFNVGLNDLSDSGPYLTIALNRKQNIHKNVFLENIISILMMLLDIWKTYICSKENITIRLLG